ncbi:MAG: hypothetical protein IT167_18245 [Bryobacterales bacterium]|nr:hypothetical protein [Bryobacterales bacterium]
MAIGKSEDVYRKHGRLGAHGHLHAIRTRLYPYPPAWDNQRRVVYEPKAIVYEEAQACFSGWITR